MIHVRSTLHKFVAALVVAALFSASLPHEVMAAPLTGLSNQMSRLTISTPSNHRIQFTTPTGVAAGQTMTVTFPAGFTMGSVAFGDVDVSDDGVDLALAATASGATWGASVSGQVLTITSGTGTIAAGSVVVIEIGTNATFGTAGVNRITNPGTAANYSITIGGTFTDTGSILVSILTNDQVQVSATVAQSITFTISDNTIGFGTLSSSAARFATGDTNGTGTEAEAHNIVVGTNATGGYTLGITGSTLTSGSDTITAITGANATSSVGSEQFGVRATASGGVGAVNAGYSASGFLFDPAGFPTFASATAASANTTYSVRYLANISSNTEAGSYTSSVSYLATANF